MTQASALTEGVDLSLPQQLVTNSLSITPSEHGVICTLSKRLIRRQGDSNVISTTGELIANSLRRRQSNDVIALYDGFSKSTPGTGTSVDITTFRGSVAYLMTDNSSSYGPAPMPIRAALHIEQISDIILDISDPGTAAGNRPAGFGDELLQRWWKGTDRLYGVQVFHSGNIQVSSNDAKGAMFSPGALFMVTAEGSNDDVVEETDMSARLVEYGIFQEWGEAERADTWGVEVYSNAAATV